MNNKARKKITHYSNMMNINSTNAKRDRVLDVARGCGILLVVFGHICHLHPYWSIIYSFHMPLFFLMAGINFDSHKYAGIGELMKKKIQSMIVPYLFFCLFGIAYNLVYFLLTQTSTDQIHAYLIKLPFAVLCMPNSKYSQLFNTPLWFVPCLVLLEIIYYLLDHISNRWHFWLCVIVVTTFGYYTSLPSAPVYFNYLPWNFSIACFALIFFAVGNNSKRFVKKYIINATLTPKYIGVLFISFTIAFLLTGYIGSHNSGSFGSRELGNGLLQIVTGCTGTICVFIGVRFLKRVNILAFLGQNSFTIMGCHIPLYYATIAVLKYLKTYFSNGILEYTESSLFECIVMCIYIVFISMTFTNSYSFVMNFKKKPIK